MMQPLLPFSVRRGLLGACVALGIAALPALAVAQAAPRPGTLGSPRTTPPPPRPATPGTAAPGANSAPRAIDPGVSDTAKPLTLYGTVFDSLAQKPLAGATVQLASETNRSLSFSATTDAAGRYRMPGVRPGRYLAGFFQSDIDALGIQLPPRLVMVMPDTAARLDFDVPGPRQLRQLLCGPSTPGDSSGMLIGVVRDAESGMAVQNAKVVVTWNEVQITPAGIRNAHRRYPAKVRADGGFSICGLPSDGQVIANAEAPGRPGGLIEVDVPSRGLVRRDFFLGDSVTTVAVQLPDTDAVIEKRPANPITVTRGNSRLSGTVRSRDGRLISGARLQIWGSGITGSSSDNGAFALGGLPAGTFSLEVRAIGYEPRRVAVDLSPKRQNSVDVVLEKQVATLSTVVTTGERSKAEKDFTGFLDRQKNGFGKYFDEDAIEKRNPFVMTDLMRTTPGMTVAPNGSFGYVVRGRGGCTPSIFIDGMRAADGADEIDNLVRPSDVGGVEVYNSSAGVPPQYSGMAGGDCGVILVWTKRGGPAKRAQ